MYSDDRLRRAAQQELERRKEEQRRQNDLVTMAQQERGRRLMLQAQVKAEEERARNPPPRTRLPVENLARGQALGLAEAGTSLAGVVPWMMTQVGRLPGGKRTRQMGESGLERIEGARQFAEDFFDPDLSGPPISAGRVGRLGGRMAGELVAAASASRPLLQGAETIVRSAAPSLLPKASQFLSRFGPRTQAAIRTAAADAPISALQAAAGAGEGQEGGLVLPGFPGAMAEGVLFGGAAGALTARRGTRLSPESQEVLARRESPPPVSRLSPEIQELLARREARSTPAPVSPEPELATPQRPTTPVSRESLVPGVQRSRRVTEEPQLRSARELADEREELRRINQERADRLAWREARVTPTPQTLIGITPTPEPRTRQDLIRPVVVGGSGQTKPSYLENVFSRAEEGRAPGIVESSTPTAPPTTPDAPPTAPPTTPDAPPTAPPNIQQAASEPAGQFSQLRMQPDEVEPPRAVRVSRPGQSVVAKSNLGGAFPARYVLIEADDLLASNNPSSFGPEPDYPAGVQMRGRQYETSNAQKLVIQQAAELDPSRALDATNMMEIGPPVVTRHGRAIAGNSRSMALRRAQQEFPAKYNAYRRTLTENAERFGLSADDVNAMQAPVLVRQLEGDLTFQQMRNINMQSDIVGTKSKRPSDVAREKASLFQGKKNLTDYLIENLDVEDETLNAFLNRAAGRKFVDMLVNEEVFTPNELSSLLTDGGNIDEWGKDVIRNLIKAAALDQYDDLPAGIMRKLEPSTPALALVRGLPGDIAPLIQEAGLVIKSASESGLTLDQHRLQGSMFDEVAAQDKVYEMAKYLERTNQRQITQDMREYAGSVFQNRPQENLGFGFLDEVTESVDPAEVAQRAGFPVPSMEQGGFATREVLESLAGAGLGATAGVLTGEEENVIGGAVAGAIGVPLISRSLRSTVGRGTPSATPQPAQTPATPQPAQTAAAAQTLRNNPANEALSDEQIQAISDYVTNARREMAPFRHLSPYEIEVMEGRIGIPKDEPLFVGSLNNIDPSGGLMAAREEADLVSQGMQRFRVPDELVEKLSRELDIDITQGKAGRMTTPRFVALGRRIFEDRAFIAKMEKEIQSVQASDVRAAYDEAIEAAYKRLLNYDKEFNAAASETGRQLRILRQMADMMGGTSAAYQAAARRYLGVREINSSVQDAITKIYNQAGTQAERDRQIATYLQSLKKSTLLEAAVDVARWGLLTAPASIARNVVGGIEVTTLNMVEAPISAAIDQVFSATQGVARTTVATPRSTKAFLRGAVGELRTWNNYRQKYLSGGIDPENPLETLNQRRVNYESVLGDNEYLKMLRPGARALQLGADAVYGTMAATDAVFYKGFLNSALEQRAVVRALNDGLKPRSVDFENAVRSYMDPDNMRPVDVIMAQVEALEATLKSPTVVAQMAQDLRKSSESVGALMDFVVPFQNTPTNIIRKAMERVPIVGVAVSEGQVTKLRKKLENLKKIGIDISDQDIASELRKYRIGTGARQITGAGLLMGGYFLHKSGLLSSEYTPYIGREQAEQQEARRRSLLGLGALSLRVGDTNYSVGAGLGIMGPLLAMGAALSAADSYDEGVSVQDKVGAAAKSAGRTALEVPVLTAFADLQTLIQTGGREGSEYAARQLTRFIPGSSLLRATARGIDREAATRSPEGFVEALRQDLPFARQTLPPRTNPLGDVYPAANPVDIMFNPFSPRRNMRGPLYEALDRVGFYPTPALRLPEESRRDYTARRREEGRIERALLEGLMTGSERAWEFVGNQAFEDFRQSRRQSEDWQEVLRATLQKQRAATSRERREREGS
jgi:hypothetical protein